MYEDQTFDVILDRMLSRIPESFDKREGSIIYDALAPAALELESAYGAIDAVLDETFADTASRMYLILRCQERGITPIESTNAVLKGAFNVEIPEDTRFSLEDYNFSSGKSLGSGEMIDDAGDLIPVYYYELTAEEDGAGPNNLTGSLIPIDYVEGLYFARAISCEIEGIDAEETESLRERYIDSFSSLAFGGNQKEYIEITEGMVGTGNVKVIPAWKSGNPGKVDLIIRASNDDVPTQALIDSVQEAIDPKDETGDGVGIAPIDHRVTVIGAEAFKIAISANFTLSDGYTFDGVKEALKKAVQVYFSKQNKAWTTGNIIIRRSQVESAMIEVPGVTDIENLALNGESKNIEIADNKIAQIGEISEAAS